MASTTSNTHNDSRLASGSLASGGIADFYRLIDQLNEEYCLNIQSDSKADSICARLHYHFCSSKPDILGRIIDTFHEEARRFLLPKWNSKRHAVRRVNLRARCPKEVDELRDVLYQGLSS